MRMSTNEKSRWIALYFRPNNRIIPGWRSTNMGHPDGHAFQLKPLMLGTFTRNKLIIDIPVNGPKRFKGPELVNNFERTNITGMPDFIAAIKMGKELRI